MRILLTNDDGYRADGINALYKALEAKGHEVYMVAPHTQQSGRSHAMTVAGSYNLHRHSERIWSVEGTPVDTMIIVKSTDHFCPIPDLVVSGINDGYNLSTDTIYSGTCGAARQAAMYGIPAIAMSQDKGETGYDFPRLAAFLADNLEALFPLILPGTFMNLNFPSDWNGRLKKAGHGRKHYHDTFTLHENGGESYTVTVEGYKEAQDERGVEDILPFDYTVCGQGYGSITMLPIDPCIDLKATNALVLPPNLD